MNRQSGAESFDTLTRALLAKMHAHRKVLERVKFFRVTVRTQRNGEVEIEIEPKL